MSNCKGNVYIIGHLCIQSTQGGSTDTRYEPSLEGMAWSSGRLQALGVGHGGGRVSTAEIHGDLVSGGLCPGSSTCSPSSLLSPHVACPDISFPFSGPAVLTCPHCIPSLGSSSRPALYGYGSTHLILRRCCPGAGSSAVLWL